MLEHHEAEFVVAGPGARDGLSNCLKDAADYPPARLIRMVCDGQEQEFAQRGIAFLGLFGRRLQPIDCQNLFCEISKCARAVNAEVAGISGRTRIKQLFAETPRPMQASRFSPRWNLAVPQTLGTRPMSPRLL